MASLRLFFLGPPRIERDGRLLDTDTRKATAMLAYLTLPFAGQSQVGQHGSCLTRVRVQKPAIALNARRPQEEKA
jgi:hypothetical protein